MYVDGLEMTGSVYSYTKTNLTMAVDGRVLIRVGCISMGGLFMRLSDPAFPISLGDIHLAGPSCHRHTETWVIDGQFRRFYQWYFIGLTPDWLHGRKCLFSW